MVVSAGGGVVILPGNRRDISQVRDGRKFSSDAVAIAGGEQTSWPPSKKTAHPPPWTSVAARLLQPEESGAQHEESARHPGLNETGGACEDDGHAPLRLGTLDPIGLPHQEECLCRATRRT